MSNLDGIDQALTKAAEDRTLIERAMGPSRAMADIVNAIQLNAIKLPAYLTALEDPAKAIRPPPHIVSLAEIAKAMHPPAHLTALAQMMTAMQREHRLFADLVRPPRFLADVTKQNAQMRALSESITAPYRAIKEMFRSQSSVFEGLSAQIAVSTIKFSVPQFSQAILAWNVASIGLANRMSDIGLLPRRAMLSARLFEASNAYVAFVGHTTKRLATDPAPDIAARLRGSLNLAEQQLLDITDTVIGFIEVPDDEEEPDNKRELNALLTQQNELLTCDAVEDETDTEAMTIVSPTAQTVQCGRRVLNRINQCNGAGKTSGKGEEIFKPTTRLLEAYHDLPWLSSTNRNDFANVVDCLYFIFYEGAGFYAGAHRKLKLRFLDDSHGGLLTEADCKLIWCIRTLRDKWTRHDADHGREKDSLKSWSELTECLCFLGLTEHPTEARHFQQLHHQLLVMAEDFLVLLLSKFKLKQ
jgi:hypothetical protein